MSKHIVCTDVGNRVIDIKTGKDERLYAFTDLTLGETLEYCFDGDRILIIKLPLKMAKTRLGSFIAATGAVFDSAMMHSDNLSKSKIDNIKLTANDITIVPEIKEMS